MHRCLKREHAEIIVSHFTFILTLFVLSLVQTNSQNTHSVILENTCRMTSFPGKRCNENKHITYRRVTGLNACKHGRINWVIYELAPTRSTLQTFSAVELPAPQVQHKKALIKTRFRYYCFHLFSYLVGCAVKILFLDRWQIPLIHTVREREKDWNRASLYSSGRPTLMTHPLLMTSQIIYASHPGVTLQHALSEI